MLLCHVSGRLIAAQRVSLGPAQRALLGPAQGALLGPAQRALLGPGVSWVSVGVGRVLVGDGYSCTSPPLPVYQPQQRVGTPVISANKAFRGVQLSSEDCSLDAHQPWQYFQCLHG